MNLTTKSSSPSINNHHVKVENAEKSQIEEQEDVSTVDSPPDDVQAFFGHPLHDGDGNPKSSGAALLHEFYNLPAIDRQEQKRDPPAYNRESIRQKESVLSPVKQEPDTPYGSFYFQETLDKPSDVAEEKVETTIQEDMLDMEREASPSMSVIKETDLKRVDQEEERNKEHIEGKKVLTDESTEDLIYQSPALLEANFPTHSLPIKHVTENTDVLSSTVVVKSEVLEARERTVSPVVDSDTGNSGRKVENPKKALAEMLKSKHQMMSGHSNIMDASNVQGFIDEALHIPQDMIPYGVKSEGFLKQLNASDITSYDSVIHGVNVTEQSAVCHQTLAQDNSFGSIVQSTQGQYFQVLQPVQTHDTSSCMTNAYYSNYNFGKPMEQDKTVDIDRYIGLQSYPYPNHCYQPYTSTGETDSMKSPDSGYQEPCLSPATGNMAMKDLSGYLENTINKTKTPTKRRRSSNVGLYVRQYSNPDKQSNGTIIPKLEVNHTGYSYCLDTPISTTQKLDEDRITYLNKSQYYGLTLENTNMDRFPKTCMVKSIIMLVFRQQKNPDEERKAFEFWHGRQHSYKQRLLDIDTKNSQGIGPGSIEERAFNAVVVRWNPRDGQVKVNIAANCLSTDFSNQKGVKGIPLHVQIDTFEDNHNTPVHRGFCQIKVFCDKGAERKTRDEERRKTAKSKLENYSSRSKQSDLYHTHSERSEFYSIADLLTIPAFFSPALDHIEYSYKSRLDSSLLNEEDKLSCASNEDRCEVADQFYQPAKRICQNSRDSKILLYVKEQKEQAFTALMLKQPTVTSLLQAIEEKYPTCSMNTTNIFKKSLKGILVKMDDNIVQHYSHESTFVIEITHKGDQYDVILNELDTQT